MGNPGFLRPTPRPLTAHTMAAMIGKFAYLNVWIDVFWWLFETAGRLRRSAACGDVAIAILPLH